MTYVNSYRFQLGRYECISISDGSVSYPPGHVFANVPAPRIEEALARVNLPVDLVTTPCSVLYTETGKHRLLVDVGAGTLWPSAGRLAQNLRAAGVESTDIDAVILTHAHPGHIGGILGSDGMPVYDRARYYIAQDEWEFWTSEVAFSKAPERHVVIARNSLEPIRDRMQLVNGEQEIIPGIKLIPAPGHTPGHVVVSVSCGDASLLYIGDTVFHPFQIAHPEWFPIYDILPRQAAATKSDILGRATKAKALVMGHHLAPFPSLGYVSEAGTGWRWQPIEAAL